MSVSDAQYPGESDTDGGRKPGAESTEHDFAQHAARWVKDLNALSPLMKHPTAAMAAATAVGFGMTSHFAGFMLGAMQGMVEAATKAAGTAEEAAKQALAEADRAKAAADALAEKAERAAAKTAAQATAATAAPDVAVAPEVTAAPASLEAEPPVAETAVASEPDETEPAPTAAKAGKAKATATGDKPARARRAKVDDLKRIEGVGPKLEQVLKGLGVTRFAEIAAWTDEDIARFDAALGVTGRIARDRWVEQAKALTKG